MAMIQRDWQFTGHWSDEHQGMILDAIACDGQPQAIAELPESVTDFLMLEQRGDVWVMAPGHFANAEANAEALAANPILASGPEPNSFRFVEYRNEPEPPKTYEGPREGGIYNLQDLMDYFGAENPWSLNRRIYKDTSCGASISIELADGTWLYNGRDGWADLTPETPIKSFTIQTIVEGSDATVDSSPFYLPCSKEEVDNWIENMEAQASALWERDNYTHFYLKDEDYHAASGQITSDAVEFTSFEESDNLPMDELKAAIWKLDQEREQGIDGATVTAGDRTWTLEEYTPALY